MEKNIECISLTHIPHGTPVFFSIGHRSIANRVLRRLEWITDTAAHQYPFDELITRLPVVKHCIETDFRFVLDASLYVWANTQTMRHATTPPLVIARDTLWFNTYYQNHAVEWMPVRMMQLPRACQFPNDTHAYHLAIRARDESCIHMATAVDDLRERVGRWRHMMQTPSSKRFLYVHPLISESEYKAHKYTLVRECIEFQEWFAQQTPHVRGCFVFMVRTTLPAPMTNHIPHPYPDMVDHVYCGHRWKSYDTPPLATPPECDIYAIYANRALEDAGDGYYDANRIEMDVLLDVVRESMTRV